MSEENSDNIQAHPIYYQLGLNEGIYLFTTPQRVPSGEVVDLLFNFGLCLPPGNQDLINAEGLLYDMNPREDCVFYSNWLPLHSLDENKQTVNVLKDIFMPYMSETFLVFFSHLENAEKLQPYFDQYVHYLTSYTEYLTIAIGASLLRRGLKGGSRSTRPSNTAATWTRAIGWTILATGFIDLVTPVILEGFQVRENLHRMRWQHLQAAQERLHSSINRALPSSKDDEPGSFDLKGGLVSEDDPEPLSVESRLRTFLEDAIARSLQQTWQHSPGVCLPTIKAYRDFTFLNLSFNTNRRFS